MLIYILIKELILCLLYTACVFSIYMRIFVVHLRVMHMFYLMYTRAHNLTNFEI